MRASGRGATPSGVPPGSRVVTTSWPPSASHCASRRSWVDLPTPSPPSKEMKVPGELTDRYLDSSVAYQGTGRDLGADEVEQLSLWAVEGLLPDLTVLLDLDPAVGLCRLTGDPDRLERAGAEFHARTRQAFLDRAAAQPGRWLVVDASQPVDAIGDMVRSRVAQLLDGGPR